ncbi:class I SAM-dependent methyltransferase [Streptomyces triticagri]|uniref:class I SAM-dependent methyltransferase n=1 Tax=Streptomyces triticagri TaxID=2293568 RepID=UPI001F34F619|nr:class I SAM-dependent methyltransferase [Streptomyces triticagri]
MTTTYEDPLAYALGLQGAALMRAFTGKHDRAFTRARVDEIRQLLDEPSLQGAGVDSSPEMLALARRGVPRGTFRPGAVQALPVADSCVDLVSCSLALTPVPRLEPALK